MVPDLLELASMAAECDFVVIVRRCDGILERYEAVGPVVRWKNTIISQCLIGVKN